MSNKHQMLRKSHFHRPISSQEDLFILPNVPNHFFVIKLFITGWVKNCNKKVQVDLENYSTPELSQKSIRSFRDSPSLPFTFKY